MNVRLYTVVLVRQVCLYYLDFLGPEENKNDTTADYNDLIGLFQEFREFQQPAVINGVPDGSPEAMQKQAHESKGFQERLTALEIGDCPVSRQVDYHMVRAEMNTLDFYLRVLKPTHSNHVIPNRTHLGGGS